MIHKKTMASGLFESSVYIEVHQKAMSGVLVPFWRIRNCIKNTTSSLETTLIRATVLTKKHIVKYK